MRKLLKIRLIVLLLVVASLLGGCQGRSGYVVSKKTDRASNFTVVAEYKMYSVKVIYDSTTNVLYAASNGRENRGEVAPLYNADGSFRVYTGDEPEFVDVTKDAESLNIRVVYDAATKVMYAVSDGAYNRGNFTPLYNADGSLRLY